MACFVYVLGCASAAGPRTYIGWTNDLDRRLNKHNSGAGAKSTRGRVWSLLYVERYETKSEAMSREWRLKRDAGMRRQLRLCVSTECGET